MKRPDPKNLREGFTTGACATAAAGAATRALISGKPVDQITIHLPVRENVTFEIACCEFNPDRSVVCGVIKDAGDDPDVTHGAEIRARVSWTNQKVVALVRGDGVGLVTKPGLPVEVGQPAINPVPRRMITRIVTDEAGALLDVRGLRVEISVPGGDEIAAETLNPRLGIVGGISILGTSGIVKPFSTSAYRAAIYTELKVARQNGVEHTILTTGSRSERYALEHYPDRPELGMVQVGDHMDYGLRQARRLQFERVTLSGMVGKISKLAQGRMQTHVSRGEVDFKFLRAVAQELGADTALQERIQDANTAHHVQMILDRAEISGLENRLAQMAAERSYQYIEEALPVEVLLWTIKGELLAIGEVGS